MIAPASHFKYYDLAINNFHSNFFYWNVSDEEKSFWRRSTRTMKTLLMPADSSESYTMDWWVDDLSRLLMARESCVSWSH